MVHCGQVIAVVGIGKLIGSKTHFYGSQRPQGGNYKGMPSGHTASAWASASYMRVYCNNKLYSAPFYAAGAFTGFSRVVSKRHTLGQVLASVVISELIMQANSYFKWEKLNVGFMGNRLEMRYWF